MVYNGGMEPYVTDYKTVPVPELIYIYISRRAFVYKTEILKTKQNKTRCLAYVIGI